MLQTEMLQTEMLQTEMQMLQTEMQMLQPKSNLQTVCIKLNKLKCFKQPILTLQSLQNATKIITSTKPSATVSAEAFIDC